MFTKNPQQDPCLPKGYTLLKPDTWMPVVLGGIRTDEFITPRKNNKEEKLRRFIVEALSHFKKLPENEQSFFLQFPEFFPNNTLMASLRFCHENGGDRLADKHDVALLFATMICNGAPWESLCQDDSPFESFFLISMGDNKYGLMGNAKELGYNNPMFWIHPDKFNAYSNHAEISYSIPLVKKNIHP